MSQLALYLLGQFQTTVDGDGVTAFRTDKVRALLAYLAVESGRSLSRDTLGALLWPEGAPESVRTNLRQTLCRLRDALHDRDRPRPFLLATIDTVQLNPTCDYWVDVLEFDRLFAACEQHRHRSLASCRTCAERLTLAVALYRGEFLAGLCVKDSPVYAEWSLTYQQALHRKVMAALQQLAMFHMQRGEVAAAERYLQRQVALEPWNESAHRQLMQLYAANGRRNAAVAQYLCCHRALVEQIGITPDKITTDLVASIRAGEPIAWPVAKFVNAPTPPTTLLGRAHDLALVSETLQNPHCRLLTLVGLGGCGKTRLALEVANQEAGAFRDGACFCSFVPANLTESPASTLAQALGLAYSSADDAQMQVRRFLCDREMLLVLDNLEHLSAPSWVAQLLHAAPRVVILATSQYRLDLQAEWRIEVRGLSYPAWDNPFTAAEALRFPAVQLFTQRAVQARAGFTLTDDTAPHVVRISRHVEGLPLALELAASWVGIMSCAEIADAIDTSLDFLATAWCDVPVRQRSLRATLDYGWDLLSREEQDAFACLSVFQGEFCHAAARAVVSSPCAFRCRNDEVRERPVPGAGCLFKAFADKALLQEVAPGRYRLHSLVRQYAEEKLARSREDALAARWRFIDYFAGLASRAAAAWTGPREDCWRNLLQQERQNIEAALAFALDDFPEAAQCLMPAVERYSENS